MQLCAKEGIMEFINTLKSTQREALCQQKNYRMQSIKKIANRSYQESKKRKNWGKDLILGRLQT